MSTFTIPGRRRTDRKHRALDRVKQLEATVKDQSLKLQAADKLIGQILREKSDTYLDLRTAEQARDCAQAAAAVKDLQLRDLHTRIRDLEEQRGEAPAEPLVTAQRFDTGPVLRAGKRPVPGWASDEDSSETTQSIPIAQLPRPAA